jgi:hypothetical protein
MADATKELLCIQPDTHHSDQRRAQLGYLIGRSGILDQGR